MKLHELIFEGKLKHCNTMGCNGLPTLSPSSLFSYIKSLISLFSPLKSSFLLGYLLRLSNSGA